VARLGATPQTRRGSSRRSRLANAGAAVTAATALALPVVAAGTSEDPAPPIPDAVRDVLHEHEAELAQAKRAERRQRRRARRAERRAHLRWRQVVRLRAAVREQVRLGGASGLERGLLCIHGHEGNWRDTGDPYWGGMQMDRSFMATYGGPFLRAFGPASNWTPAMQVATAERAYLAGRGFGPWPNTRLMCGL
jgi:hypothetical protein